MARKPMMARITRCGITKTAGEKIESGIDVSGCLRGH